MRLKDVKVGQTVYVNKSVSFFSEDPNITKYIVTKINTNSIYAFDKKTKTERRFNKRSGICDAYGLRFKIYVEEKQYWDEVERSEEKHSLSNLIERTPFRNLSLEKLREIVAIINK